MTPMVGSLLLATALAAAGATLSIVVVARRWAFIGEGVSHSGFGGAGTAWLLMLAFPALETSWTPYLAAAVFCMLTALAIGSIARSGRLHIDAAIGVFLTASLAWGFLAEHVYLHRRNLQPPMFETLLFGNFGAISSLFLQTAICVCLAVIVIVAAFWKEVAAYSFDPLLAQTAGAPVRLIHYLLMILLATVIIVGLRIAGSVLVTALLVLPAATATQLSQRLNTVLSLSLALAILAAVVGVLAGSMTTYLPAGPLIVLTLFVEFVVAYAVRRMSGKIDFNSAGG